MVTAGNSATQLRYSPTSLIMINAAFTLTRREENKNNCIQMKGRLSSYEHLTILR